MSTENKMNGSYDSKTSIKKIYFEEWGPEFAGRFNVFAKMVYAANKDKGFWDMGVDARNKSELIALMHSELSEALEGLRKDTMDDHLPTRKTFEVELADTIIRIMDAAGAYGLDVGGAIVDKLIYNLGRAHKHGKSF